jgi:hypothetical protein
MGCFARVVASSFDCCWPFQMNARRAPCQSISANPIVFAVPDQQDIGCKIAHGRIMIQGCAIMWMDRPIEVERLFAYPPAIFARQSITQSANVEK